MKNLTTLPVLFVVLSLLVGCAQVARGAVALTVTPPVDSAEAYTVDITAADFVAGVDNPYFPLTPGTKWAYEAKLEDGSTERIELEILSETREVNGVPATILHDMVFVDGELVEDTYDWFGQDKNGNVWYLGEDVDNYENGVIVDHEGAWEWGVDGALPGIIMWADPAFHLDEAYYQEYYVGEAEDMGQVLSVGENVTVPYGSFDNVVQTYDFSSLDPDIQSHKFYAAGIGVIKEVELNADEEVVLVEYTPADTDKQIDCASALGETEIAGSRLFVEYQSTDGDLGVHGYFDDDGWSELCVYGPSGEQVLAIRPQAQLKDLTMASIFFESREPLLSEFSFADLKANFPEGQYQVRGVAVDGTGLTGSATFSHNIPAPPVITLPALAEDADSAGNAVVSTTDLVIEWQDVTETVDGDPVAITGYEVIITKEEHDDQHGFSQPIFDVHLPADRNTLDVSAAFLEPGTVYELEVLALEESGNQTISIGFFETE